LNGLKTDTNHQTKTTYLGHNVIDFRKLCKINNNIKENKISKSKIID